MFNRSIATESRRWYQRKSRKKPIREERADCVIASDAILDLVAWNGTPCELEICNFEGSRRAR